MKKHFSLLLFLSTLLLSNASLASYIEVTLLGTGTPRLDIARLGPATLVETKGKYFLFDSGRATSVRLQQARISPAQINHIFITHLHSDHINGLADVWLTSWIWQRQMPLTVIGPTGTVSMMRHMKKAYQNDIRYRAANDKLDPKHSDIISTEIAGDQIVYQHDGITITAFTVNHGLVKPAFGYRIDSDDHSVVISGDTTYSDNLISHAKDVDLIVHEIADADQKLLADNPRLTKVMAYHTTPSQAALVLNQVKPKEAVFTHILLFGITEQEVMSKIQQQYNGSIHIGHDLLKIGVGEKVSVYPANNNRIE
jgi:ribonuclease Z